MTDVAAAGASTTATTVVVNTSETQVKKNKKTERPKATTHPTTAVMVNNAIQCLKERGGSSLQAIRKYITATYKIDGDKFSPFIKKYLKASVTAGTLVQTKGKGASGSFKLASSAVTRVKPKTTVGKSKKNALKSAVSKPKGKVTTTTTTTEKTTSTTETKKSAKTKKAAAVVEKKKPVVVRAAAAAAAAKSKSPSKVKQTTKAPTKKPKSPNPKTTKPKVAKKKAATSLKKK